MDLEFAGPGYVFEVLVDKVFGSKISEKFFRCYLITFFKRPKVPFRCLEAKFKSAGFRCYGGTYEIERTFVGVGLYL